jgi:hypothetical protein
LAIKVEVLPRRFRRIVMVRFERAAVGDPQLLIPQPDDRGYADATHGPIFGLLQGDTVTVRLRREMIESAGSLFVTSSDESIFKVVTPASGELPNTDVIDIQINGVSGGTPKTATLEVRFKTGTRSTGVATRPVVPTGPIIHQATINVWDPPLDVMVTPHLVTIEQAGAPAPRPSIGTVAAVNAILDISRAIWRPCGIRLLPSSGATFAAAARSHTVALATAGVVADDFAPGGEVDTILNTDHVPRTVNAYFVHRIGNGGTLGLGISEPTRAAFGLSRPGIILADQTAAGVIHDVPFSGNDLAHEIGHFLTLPHVENLNLGNHRNDTWARRCLMHPGNRLPDPRRQFQRDIGYGELTAGGTTRGRRGALITVKDLTQLATDAECARARGAVSTI